MLCHLCPYTGCPVRHCDPSPDQSPRAGRSTALLQHQARPHPTLLTGPTAAAHTAAAAGTAAAPVQLTVQNSPAPPLPVDSPQTPEQVKVMHDYEQWLISEQEVSRTPDGGR